MGAEFSRRHPALAPMLSGPSRDPDVERLLEGVAYLAGTLRHRMDDEFPEFISSMMYLSVPHLLQPTPSTTLLQFTPEDHLSERMTVPARTPVNSIAVDGTVCCFETAHELFLDPLELQDIRWEGMGDSASKLTLSFRVLPGASGRFNPDALRLHCTGEIGPATGLYALLTTKLRSVSLIDASGDLRRLPKENVFPAAFEENSPLLPYPAHIFPGYRILMEYFILPEKFLSVGVKGLAERLDVKSAKNFSLIFELEAPEDAYKLNRDSLALHVVPACNSFERDSQPMALTHQASEYPLRVERDEGHCQVLGVNLLEGVTRRNGYRREFLPFHDYEGGQGAPLYVLRWRGDALTEEVKTFLELVYPGHDVFIEDEIMIGKLQCCNGHLPERLRLGDIHAPTPTSPVHCTFRNITTPTGMASPHLDKGSAWRLMAHLRFNLLHLKRPEDLRTVLMLYAGRRTRDRARFDAGVRRIQGITDFSARAMDRLYRGQLIRGTAAGLSLDPQSFAGPGDMHLFAQVLQYFFSSQSQINSFVQLTMTDDSTGISTTWKPRAGEQPLL